MARRDQKFNKTRINKCLFFLINFRKKPKFGANFDEIAIFGMKLQNFGRWRLILALDMSVFFNNDLIFTVFS